MVAFILPRPTEGGRLGHRKLRYLLILEVRGWGLGVWLFRSFRFREVLGPCHGII